MPFLCIVIDSRVAIRNLKLLSVAMETQKWVHLALLSNFETFCAAVKGKAIPLQVWTSPEGSRKLRFPDYVTTAQDGGKVVSLTHRPPPGNVPGTHFC